MSEQILQRALVYEVSGFVPIVVFNGLSKKLFTSDVIRVDS